MTPRWRVWLLGGLLVAVIIAAMYLPTLQRRVRQAARVQQKSEEQARMELTQPLAANPGEQRTKAKLFWSSGDGDGSLRAVTIELPLSSEPVLRAKQVLNTLLAGPVNADLRTLPPEAVLLAFYLLPDGMGIADFSEALATSTPSGIQSEQQAVNSIIRTLEANVPQVQRLKFLIHGQEVDTLAGHLDLMQTFTVNTKAAMQSPAVEPRASAEPVTPPVEMPKAAKTAEAPGAGKVEKLTVVTPPGKLARAERKQ
jgi:hypothetical protein